MSETIDTLKHEIEMLKKSAEIWEEEGIDANIFPDAEDRYKFFNQYAKRLEGILHSAIIELKLKEVKKKAPKKGP